MEKVYAALIIKRLRTFKSVPDKIKERVRKELIERGHQDLIEE